MGATARHLGRDRLSPSFVEHRMELCSTLYKYDIGGGRARRLETGPFRGAQACASMLVAMTHCLRQPISLIGEVGSYMLVVTLCTSSSNTASTHSVLLGEAKLLSRARHCVDGPRKTASTCPVVR